MLKTRRVAFMLDLNWPVKWHTEVFAGAQRYAQEQGWKSVIDEFVFGNLRAHPKPAELYDGVIGRITPELATLGNRLDLPMVNTWYNSPARAKLHGVFPDCVAAGQISAEHLLARGLRRFAVLTRNDQAQLQVAEAFRETVQAAGFPCVVVRLPLSPASTYTEWRKAEQQIEGWMKDWQPPIGVSICDEVRGRMVVELCHNRGWRVPKDVAIVAGANDELSCNHPQPSLTSMEIGFGRIGYEAARLLDQLMEKRGKFQRTKKLLAKPQHLILPPVGLVVRESTDFYAVEDELVAQALQFIAANSHREINCDAVAKSLAVHPRTLQRRFSSFVDWPIADEIRRVRIERAKRLLTESKQSMVEIAQEVGFGDRMQLYSVFRREVGVTPSAYRKQRQLEASH